ncbi:PAS domain-containing protein [Antarcticimicrobium luteum]|nr:PAS domain-containing protein [Antarcticimicrobium luteum]
MRQTSQGQPGRNGDKIVVLDRFRSGRSLSPLRQAEAYWLALCGAGGVPRRSQVDPRALDNILTYSFILERVARRAARFRLAGDHLTDLAGMELRGTLFTALFTEGARAQAGAILQRVFAAPAVAELRLNAPAGAGSPEIEGRMLLLPLATEHGEIARALGVLVADGIPRTPPIRFDIANRLLRPVTSGATPGAPLPLPAPCPVEEFAEVRSEIGGRPPHLRLVT